jgi:hypothetical protein
MVSPALLFDYRSNTDGMGWAGYKGGKGPQCVENAGKWERKYFWFRCE